MRDTSLKIEAHVAQMIAARTPAQRLKIAASMFDAGKKLMEAGLREWHGPLNDAQLRTLVFTRLYGDCFSNEEIARIMQHIPNMQIVAGAERS